MKKILLKFTVTAFVFILFISCNNVLNSVAKDIYIGKKTMTEVRASHLLVSTKEEAEKLRTEILAGKDFAEVAKEVSKCPSGARGGDLGFFGKGRMVPEFDQAAFSLPVGEISEPIQTQFGWHLLIVTDQK